MIKTFVMGVVAIALSFFVAATFMGGASHANAQTATSYPTVTQSATVSPSSGSMRTTTTPSPSTTVPSGAPRTGFQP